MPRTLLNPFMRITTEQWTLIDEHGAGSYSDTLSWGNYKIILSGGGGAGGASASNHQTSRNWANNGSNGEKIEVMVAVAQNDTKTITGIVGTGAAASYAWASKTQSPYVQVTKGAVGTGYGNGSQGTSDVQAAGGSGYDHSAAAGGSGGGSSSFVIDGITHIAKGGNGGSCRADQVSAQSGGTGGSGGVSAGTGATGGAGAYYRNGGGYSSAGQDGYVMIYKSNIYP